MRVIIACEESQTVCKAFRALGHEAYSCDIQPESGGHPEWHFQEDIFAVLEREPKFDLMIAHPPCTHLAVSGARHFAAKIADGRQQEAIDFFMKLANVDIEYYAIENPVCIMSSKWRKPDQIIQPYQFGHEFTKTTCLWLKNLPKLAPTSILEKPKTGWVNQSFTKNGRYGGFNGKYNSAKERSKTFQGIADAIASQWSEYILNENNK